MTWKPIIAAMALSVSLFAAATGNRGVTNNAKSPSAETSVALGGKQVTIEYNAPSARSRAVEGTLIPYGTAWRLGADNATTLTADTDLKIGDLTVPKGVYTLYLIAADASNWKLIVNKQTKQWGTEYSEPQDLGRTALKVARAGDMAETLKINLKPNGPKAATLEIIWGKSIATVPVKAS